MTWHLKNRELENQLLKIDSKFLENLNFYTDLRKDWDFFIVNISFPGFSSLSLRVNPKDLEEIPEYNPDTWNEYPKVTPPEGVLMRVETLCGNSTFRECAIFDHGIWKEEKNGKPDDLVIGEIIRFKLWDN